MNSVRYCLSDKLVMQQWGLACTVPAHKHHCFSLTTPSRGNLKEQESLITTATLPSGKVWGMSIAPNRLLTGACKSCPAVQPVHKGTATSVHGQTHVKRSLLCRSPSQLAVAAAAAAAHVAADPEIVVVAAAAAAAVAAL
eukprot:1145245-Pelagomonas_calceolata.AAC.2